MARPSRTCEGFLWGWGQLWPGIGVPDWEWARVVAATCGTTLQASLGSPGQSKRQSLLLL